ncbi:MAG: alkaline phosphatase family protein [Planctomycetota bacterium]|jgi:predicted AlkP superfamily pyrophosphatase or phosphodiesterase|nr:alkaline phosphatase family protein [Planctomycetota bacterium]
MSQRPLIVICAVGLSPEHLGADTPRLSAVAESGFHRALTPALPAVTTTAQATMLTGTDPAVHGIVANGWYFRDLAEVWLWRQSEALMQAPPVWERIRERRPCTVLKHFWWYAMNSSADAFVTPRPAYHADGAKSPDCYAWPSTLKTQLEQAHGTFPLFNFWGPTANITSTRWVSDSFCTAWRAQKPDLALCYLPHLDYDLQRFGPSGPHLARNLRELDACCGTVLDLAGEHGCDVLVVSEYGIEAVNTGVPINRALREAGLLTVTRNATGELLDPGTSAAFAVADHQLAHVYCRDERSRERALEVLKRQGGIEAIYAGAERAQLGLNHPRSGELVAVAAAGAWFQYEYWLDPKAAPDFAHQVEIHKKPGYDPRELLFDPHGGKFRAARALLRKKLGLRYTMNPISLDPSLVRGSHGRAPSSPEQGPILIGSNPSWASHLGTTVHQRDIAGLIERICT